MINIYTQNIHAQARRDTHILCQSLFLGYQVQDSIFQQWILDVALTLK